MFILVGSNCCSEDQRRRLGIFDCLPKVSKFLSALQLRIVVHCGPELHLRKWTMNLGRDSLGILICCVMELSLALLVSREDD